MTAHTGKLFILSFLLAIFGVGFWSCTYQPDVCKLTVVVKDVNDTTKMIVGASIVINKENGAVSASATSDQNGEARFQFDLEAVLDITATAKTFTVPTPEDTVWHVRKGKTTVRLKEGKDIRKVVLLQNAE